MDWPAIARRGGWLWPAALTLLITLWQIDQAQLWRDELATWSAASRSFGDLLRLAGTIDAVTGPYYLFMHVWTVIFGDSVLALRLPAALAMTAAAAITTLLGARLFGTRAGLLAGLLFAVMPSTSRYGQEARPYALATLFAVLATLLLVRALDRPSRGRWLGYGAAVVGLGLAHLIAVTVLAGHAAAVLIISRHDRKERVKPWLAALLPAALVLTPLALLGRGQQAQQLDWVDQATLGNIPSLPGAVAQSGAVGGFLLGLAVLGWASRGRWGTALGLCLLFPAALLFIAGLFTSLWVPRYLVFTVPLGCLLAAAPLAAVRLRTALPIVAVAGLLGAPAQLDLRRTHEWPRSRPVDYAQAAQIIADHQQPGDGIVYSPRDGWKFLDIAVAHHLGEHRPRDVLMVEDQVRRASLWATECAQPAPCLASVDRVWLLVTGERKDPLRGIPQRKAQALHATFQVDQVWTVPGLTVARLTRSLPPA